MSDASALDNKKKKFSFQGIIPWIIPLAIILFWQLVVSAGWVSSSLLPSPLDVLQDGVELTVKGELPKNMSISLYRATVGFVIGGGIGFILGFINGLSKIARLAFDSTVQMLRNIPHLALIPLVILLMGIGEPAKIFLVAIGCMFPMYINTYHGITSVDHKIIEMGKAYGLKRSAMVRKIIFPAALPTILMGVRYALGVMWTTLIVAETISASSGIGYMSTNAEQFMDMKTIILCILIYALLGKLSDFIAKNLEIIFLDWRG